MKNAKRQKGHPLRETLLLLILFGLLPINAVRAEKSAVPISLNEFVTIVTERDTVFEQILIDELTLVYQKDLRLPARDLVLSVRQDYMLALEDGGNGVTSDVSLSKLFPLLGTTVQGGYSVEEFRNGEQRSSELFVSIAQPIAENAFGRGTQLLDKIIGLEVEVARHQIVEAYEDYFATVMTAYIVWFEAWENLQIAESSYRENRKLLADIQAREKKQIALPIDVNKIKLQVLAKEEALIEFRERYQTAYYVVQRSMRTPKERTYRPTAPTQYDTRVGEFEREFLRFRNEGRTFEILDLLEKKSKLEIRKNADDLLPSVELSAGYRLRGDDYSFKDEENVLFAGITVSLPFSDQVEEAEYAISRINADKQQLVTTNTDFDLRETLHTLHGQMEREWKLLALARKRTSLARAVLTDEAENYSFGKVVLNDYIQAVNVLDDNRFSRVAREARARRQRVEWLRLSDSLLSRSDITRFSK